MAQVDPGRFTADTDDDVVVFLIGMRVNRLHRIDVWLPIMRDMARMERYLARHPEAGMLAAPRNWFGRTTMMLSYWSSAEALQAFASDATAPHLEPWRRFRSRASRGGAVGIWHETYVSRPGQREVVYVNMPAFGLGEATRLAPLGAGSATARQRLRKGASQAAR